MRKSSYYPRIIRMIKLFLKINFLSNFFSIFLDKIDLV